METKTKPENVLIRMTTDLKQRLQKLADKDNRNLSDYIRNQLINLTKK